MTKSKVAPFYLGHGVVSCSVLARAYSVYTHL